MHQRCLGRALEPKNNLLLHMRRKKQLQRVKRPELGRFYSEHIKKYKQKKNSDLTDARKIAVLGAPEGTRTPDLLVRSQSLYPAELPAHLCVARFCA